MQDKARCPLVYAAEVVPELHISYALDTEGGGRKRERGEREGEKRGMEGRRGVYVPISPLSSQSSPARGPNGSV